MRVLIEIYESILLALKAVWSNKVRSFLTTLSVVVGVSFVTLMGWILQGLDNALEETLSMFGQDVVHVDRWDWTNQTDWRELIKRKPLRLKHFKELEPKLDFAQYAYPSTRNNGATIKRLDRAIKDAMVIGTTDEAAFGLASNMESGRFFSSVEAQHASPVAVIGSLVAEHLFPEGAPLGKRIKYKGRNYTVIGVLSSRATLIMDFVDKEVYIPMKSFVNQNGKTQILITVKGLPHLTQEQTSDELIGAMRSVRNLSPGSKEDFSVNSSEALAEMFDEFRIVVWGVGLILTGLSFFVGVVGITNIMFVSVTERKREIGVRKALGARRRSIILQFLTEAVVLCIIGAFMSLALCSAIVYFAVTQFELTFAPPHIPPFWAFAAIATASIFGVLSGLIPAMSGARISPIEALRYE